MENRFFASSGMPVRRCDSSPVASRSSEPAESGAVSRIGDVLNELLAQYRQRFPHLRVALVETPAERF